MKSAAIAPPGGEIQGLRVAPCSSISTRDEFLRFLDYQVRSNRGAQIVAMAINLDWDVFDMDAGRIRPHIDPVSLDWSVLRHFGHESLREIISRRYGRSAVFENDAEAGRLAIQGRCVGPAEVAIQLGSCWSMAIGRDGVLAGTGWCKYRSEPDAPSMRDVRHESQHPWPDIWKAIPVYYQLAKNGLDQPPEWPWPPSWRAPVAAARSAHDVGVPPIELERVWDDGITPRVVAERAAGGDKAARTTMYAFGKALAVGFNQFNELNPNATCFVIGGGVAEGYEQFRHGLADELDHRLRFEVFGHPDFDSYRHPQAMNLVGVARKAWISRRPLHPQTRRSGDPG